MTSLMALDFNKDLRLTPHDVRDMIARFESDISKLPQNEIPLKHYFSKGVYAREIFLPKGTLIVGKIHRYQNMNVLSKGEVSVLSIDGRIRIKAPFTLVASPGVKRVIFAHEDSVWTTIHGTTETDLEKLEDTFIAKSYDDLYQSSDRTLADVLSTLNFTADELAAISLDETDLTPFPAPVEHLYVAPSSVHGQGLFTGAKINARKVIAPARINGKRTPAGRFTNHSGQPNAEMVLCPSGDVDLVALCEIEPGSEILTDYYFTFVKTRS